MNDPNETNVSVEVIISEAFAEVDGLLPCPLCDEKYEVSQEGEKTLRTHLLDVHKVSI